MTIIAAVKGDGDTYIGADWSTSDETTSRRWFAVAPKIQAVKIADDVGRPAYLGVAGHTAVAALLGAHLLPGLHGAEPNIDWANEVAIDMTQRLNGYRGSHIDEHGDVDSDMLLVVGDKIFYLDSNSAMEPDSPYAAIGSGEHLAMGLFFGRHIDDRHVWTKWDVDDAIAAACQFDVGCHLGDRDAHIVKVSHT